MLIIGRATVIRVSRSTRNWRAASAITGLGLLLSTLAVRDYANPPDPRDVIISVVRSAGVQLSPEDVPRWLIENEENRKAAYDALKDFLQHKPEAGNDWRNAVDAVAVVAGPSQDLAGKALIALKKFAFDVNYFDSANRLPGAPRISEASAGAKAEVPFAVAILARSTFVAKNSSVHSELDKFLIDARMPEFWRGVEWTSEAFFGETEGGKQHRNEMLAHHASLASDRLKLGTLPPSPH